MAITDANWNLTEVYIYFINKQIFLKKVVAGIKEVLKAISIIMVRYMTITITMTMNMWLDNHYSILGYMALVRPELDSPSSKLIP